VPKPIGSVLRSARERIGLTQAALANDVGIAANHLNRLESGEKSMPRFDTLARLAARLGLSLDLIAANCGYRSSPESMGIDPAHALELAARLRDLHSQISAVASLVDDAISDLETSAGAKAPARRRKRAAAPKA
jgi:transcriptional regulator with XRE-family HTH domain